MSLRKKTTMTEKGIAANRANGKRSKGDSTAAGRERIRAANTRHWFYSQAEAMALACLGEDPAELERLRQRLYDDLRPPSGLEEELVEHLVEVVWRWKRSGRQQEGFALRQAREANLTREDRLHAHMMRLKLAEESLGLLARSVAREYYVTTPEDIEKMMSLYHVGVVKEMGEIAIALFYRLKPDEDEGEDGPVEFAKARLIIRQVKEVFGTCEHSIEGNQAAACGEAGEAPPAPGAPPAAEEALPSTFTAADWAAREEARQLLENILTRQVRIFAAQRQDLLRESLAGPSPYERAAEIALAHPNVALMQRMEESSFRQIWRITNLLLKIKSHASEGNPPQYPAKGGNVDENPAA